MDVVKVTQTFLRGFKEVGMFALWVFAFWFMLAILTGPAYLSVLLVSPWWLLLYIPHFLVFTYYFGMEK